MPVKSQPLTYIIVTGAPHHHPTIKEARAERERLAKVTGKDTSHFKIMKVLNVPGDWIELAGITLMLPGENIMTDKD